MDVLSRLEEILGHLTHEELIKVWLYVHWMSERKPGTDTSKERYFKETGQMFFLGAK